MHVEVGRHRRFDLLKEGPELHRAVPALAGPDPSPGLYVKSREQVGLADEFESAVNGLQAELDEMQGRRLLG